MANFEKITIPLFLQEEGKLFGWKMIDEFGSSFLQMKKSTWFSTVYVILTKWLKLGKSRSFSVGGWKWWLLRLQIVGSFLSRRVYAGSQCLKQQVCWGAGSTQDVHSRTLCVCDYCMRSGQFAFPHANDLATTVSVGGSANPPVREDSREIGFLHAAHTYNMVVAWRARDKDNLQLDLYDDLQRCAGHDLPRLVCQLLPLPLCVD